MPLTTTENTTLTTQPDEAVDAVGRLREEASDQFITSVSTIVESQLDKASEIEDITFDEIGELVLNTASGILALIDGDAKEETGYYLIPKPYTLAEDLSISGSLQSLFDDVNK